MSSGVAWDDLHLGQDGKILCRALNLIFQLVDTPEPGKSRADFSVAQVGQCSACLLAFIPGVDRSTSPVSGCRSLL